MRPVRWRCGAAEPGWRRPEIGTASSENDARWTSARGKTIGRVPFDGDRSRAQCSRVRRSIALLLWVPLANGAGLDDFLTQAKARHGDDGERAARFLVEHMPSADRETLAVEFLVQNLELALKARTEFPWAAQVPEPLFLNDVLPYAVFDERREAWRQELYNLGRELVREARSATEAAQTLNRELFNRIQVHYHTGRRRPNQSYVESKALGKATCTGLAIILVQACRAVGIPARAVGTPMWTNERGNHTWVEFWDGDWHFMGADEYDPAGVDRGWFVGDAAQAQADVPRHAIYATSWERRGLSFPMVWARRSDTVAAVNVTGRYAKPTASTEDTARLGVRLWDRPGGTRLVAEVVVRDEAGREHGRAHTKAGTADLNDLPRFDLKPGMEGTLHFTVEQATRKASYGPLAKGEATLDAVWTELTPVSNALEAIKAWLAMPRAERPADAPALEASLTRPEAETALALLYADRLEELVAERAAEMEAKAITLGDKTLRWEERVFGEAPAGGRSLWISMHGGGNAPPAVNDRQWRNQVRLYEPAEGIYLAPRAPTDTWNLWHEAHIDPLFQRLIDNHVALRGVDPDKVYLLGYSAGGDGVWQLAPRMADRFAAAAMMAGHPNEASLLGLRNLPFAMFMGANDAAYNRNRVASERAAALDQLEKDDPGGYIHLVRIYEGTGHWMKNQDAEALPWMMQFRRLAWPGRVVWEQDDVVHRRFYWLVVPDGVPLKERARLVARVKDRTIELEGDLPPVLQLRLSDRLLDLDQPLRVVVQGREVFSGRVTRNAAVIRGALTERADASTAASALIQVMP